jgi:hypothetical protein
VIMGESAIKHLVIVGGALILAAVSACSSSASAKPAEPVAATSPVAATHSSSPALSADMTASCQIGEGLGGFAPVTDQNVSDGEPVYQVVLNNGTGSAVTVNGFAITIRAFGSTIGSDNPSVNPALMEPTETWNFTEDITSEVMPQVSDNTYLNSTCAVTSVTTDSGQVTPAVIPMQNGVAVTHAQDVQQAQQSLASDVSALTSDSATLNTDTSLAQAVDTMKTDYQQEQSDWKTEQNTACSTDEVGGDADTVGGDADTVGGDLDDLNGDVTDLQDGDIDSVQTDLSKVASDLSTLQGLGATPGAPSSAAVTGGNKALTSAANAVSWANGQGASINSAAQALATTAQNYANSQCG